MTSNRRRGGRRPLSMSRIVDATLELVDERGLGAASMREVADRLHVRAMSLYKHVESRDALFDAVVERVVNELGDDPEVQIRPLHGWRPYLHAMAHGVRRYARAHPHAFPLVATRPPSAPWINPPLRSVRWVEAMLAGLTAEGFSDEEVLYTYRAFNSFLLGYLLLETSAMTLRDPKPGDGSFVSGSVRSDSDAAESTDPVPGALSPTRTPAVRRALDRADTPRQLIDTAGDVDPERFPAVHRLAPGLAQDRWDDEFETSLAGMLDRIEMSVAPRAKSRP